MKSRRNQGLHQSLHSDESKNKSVACPGESFRSLSYDKEDHLYASPQIISHIYSPQNIYAQPQIQPKQSKTSKKTESNGISHHINKDSGYYSCEFLDQNSYSPKILTPQETTKTFLGSNGENMLSSNCGRSLGRKIPQSDSGVFTLSHVYCRPNQKNVATVQDGIYDNII